MEQAIPDQDVDLLRLAAKAAGITIDFPCGMYDPMLVVKDEFGNYRWWNPIIDDGDALRLACDLGLRVYPVARTPTGAACSAVGSATNELLAEVADMSLDTQTATRRAIVRAAAEIGRQLEGGAA